MILLHVGYAKTGTTSLQKHFFPKLKGVNYFGRDPRFSPVGKPILYKKLKTDLLNDERYLYEFFIHYLHDEEDKYKPYAEKWVKSLENNQGISLFSSENILRPGNIERLVERLHGLFKLSEVKVIFTVREQTKIIKSRLNHDFEFHEGKPEELLFDGMMKCTYPYCLTDISSKCSNTCQGKAKISLHYYDYNNVISHFENAFGRENIYVFPFEKLFKMSADVVELFSLLTENENTQIRNLLANIPKENKGKISSYSTVETAIDEKLANVRDYYRESNSLLSKKYNLKLNECGYATI